MLTCVSAVRRKHEDFHEDRAQSDAFSDFGQRLSCLKDYNNILSPESRLSEA